MLLSIFANNSFPPGPKSAEFMVFKLKNISAGIYISLECYTSFERAESILSRKNFFLYSNS